MITKASLGCFSLINIFNLLLFEIHAKFANHPNIDKANIRVRISTMVRELSRARTFVQALVFAMMDLACYSWRVYVWYYNWRFLSTIHYVRQQTMPLLLLPRVYVLQLF